MMWFTKGFYNFSLEMFILKKRKEEIDMFSKKKKRHVFKKKIIVFVLFNLLIGIMSSSINK